MSAKQKQSNPSESEQVSRAAGLYTHLNDVLDAAGQIQGVVHYHLGFQYATEQLANKLEGLGVDSSWHVLDVCCGWGVPTRYVAGRLGCRITGVDITQRSIDFAKKVTEGTDVEPLIAYKPPLLTAAGFEIVSREKVGREYAVAGDTEAINQGTSSLVQRAGGRDADQIEQFIEAYGLDAHLAALEREKMELGRFVCLKPA